MRKLILTLCTGIIMCAAAYSLYNAANDYGLATVSLPPAVWAQQDDTSGGDNTNGDNTNGGKIECDGYNVLCESYLHRETRLVVVKSNKEGVIEIVGLKIADLKKNKEYTVHLCDRSCRPHNPGTKNICVRAEEGTVVEKIELGKNTNGDSTNRN